MVSGSVEKHLWGKDHWSVLAYIESGCVDSSGDSFSPDRSKMQTNANRHPGLLSGRLVGPAADGSAYGIRLADGTELPGPDYDDWDCVEDFVREGYLESTGTGIKPEYKLTDAGIDLASALRAHKSKGGRYSTFLPFGTD